MRGRDFFASQLAHASAPTFELAWAAPEGCPSREEIAEATRARLGGTRAEATSRLFVQGTVTKEREGFVVALVLTDTRGNAVGEREVRVAGQSCRAVEEPTSLVLAMIIARLEQSTGAPEPVAPPTSEPAPPPASEPPSAPPASKTPAAPAARTPSRRPSRLLLGAAGVASLGVLPDRGLGVALRGMYSPSSVVLFGLDTSFESGGSVPVGAGKVGFQAAGLSARVGLSALRTGKLELILTVGARLGLILISPVGFPVIQNQARPAAAAGAGALLRAKLTPNLYAEALPEIEAVIVRDRFRIRDGEALYPFYRPAPFGARLALGLGYEFQ